jgi:hypothetical protein
MLRAKLLASSLNVFALLLALGLVSCGGGPPPAPATLTVENQSSFVIEQVHIAPVNNDSWGPDLLTRCLHPGESLVIDGIPCDHYDVLVIDETNTNCVLPDVTLCFSDAIWTINDRTLARCAFPM